MKGKIMQHMTAQDGNIMIMIPFMIIIIIGLFAFVSDYGRIIIVEHQMQSAADSAAIAGASMFTVEFEKNDKGKVNMNNTVIKVIYDKAAIAADKYFNKNMALLRLDADGIKILENKATLVEGNKLKYKVQFQMPINQIFVYLGAKNLQTITITSEARPGDVVS